MKIDLSACEAAHTWSDDSEFGTTMLRDVYHVVTTHHFTGAQYDQEYPKHIAKQHQANRIFRAPITQQCNTYY